jgi:hypothetical protein
MAIVLNWKRPLFWIAVPVLLFICFCGFPPPFPPLRETRPAQEQAVRADDSDEDVLGGVVHRRRRRRRRRR